MCWWRRCRKRMRIRRSIPLSAKERTIRPFRQTRNGSGGAIWFRDVECRVKGRLVGTRHYDEFDRLIIERPMWRGKKHGIELTWDEQGHLEFAEPFVDGIPHGTARQYQAGRLIGTYTLRHGTGFDIWRTLAARGALYVSEVWSMRNGRLHGVEWQCNHDGRTVWREAHWRNGQLHGVEREWNEHGRLSRGFPRYWIEGNRISKRKYLTASRDDLTLPQILSSEHKPRRAVLAEIKSLQRRPHTQKSITALIDRRLRELDSGKVRAAPWREVKRRLMNTL